MGQHAQCVVHETSNVCFDQFGSDVKLFRSGANALTVEGDVGISGGLDTKAMEIGGVSLEDIIEKIIGEALKKKQD